MIQTSAQAYRRDRWLVLLGMAVLSLLSWAYLVNAARPVDQMLAMPVSPPWDAALLVLSLVMWSVMMIAMMLPTATPMVLSFTRVQHGREPSGRAVWLTWLFVTGYLLAWIGFALVAAVAQWVFYSLGVMSSSMGSATPVLGGALLVGAGLFQWSGLKDACLTQCQSPLNFLLNQWRPGRRGALIMGLRHGLFCLGCCWLLMLLMFVGGVMNLIWMVAITVYVLAEKLLPWMRHYGRAVGVLLVASGMLLLFGGPASDNLSWGAEPAPLSIRLSMDYCEPDSGSAGAAGALCIDLLLH